MIFSNKEVIELSGGKKYIVVDSIKDNNDWYYYICEINQEETKVSSNFKIIKTVNENGNLFVKTVKDELATRLEMEFKEKLEIE